MTIVERLQHCGFPLVGGVLWLVLPSCSLSHPEPECADGRPCEAPLVCDPPRGPGLTSHCVPACDWSVAIRCPNGAYCLSTVCTTGGPTALGDVPAALDGCGFGMRPALDYTTDPLESVCRLVCDVDAHCPANHRCIQNMCLAGCLVPGQECSPPNLCVDRFDCVNERRFARIDCDGDRDLDAECDPGLQCDASALGGCGYPPPGEE